MTATGEIRFGEDGPAAVRSYVRLTASTYIQCSTYEDADLTLDPARDYQPTGTRPGPKPKTPRP